MWQYFQNKPVVLIFCPNSSHQIPHLKVSSLAECWKANAPLLASTTEQSVEQNLAWCSGLGVSERGFARLRAYWVLFIYNTKFEDFQWKSIGECACKAP